MAEQWRCMSSNRQNWLSSPCGTTVSAFRKPRCHIYSNGSGTSTAICAAGLAWGFTSARTSFKHTEARLGRRASRGKARRSDSHCRLRKAQSDIVHSSVRIYLALPVISSLAGCATSSGVVVNSAIAKARYQSAYVVVHGDNSSDMDANLQKELLRHGLSITVVRTRARPVTRS